ncbi:MAG: site-2 protease family protein [Smithellaceae bacterium]|nr:site-2 protease family protein [Smithellaceae bacterium]
MDRRILLDVGSAGPLAGMAVALPVLIVGLFLSPVTSSANGGGLEIGDSLLFYGLNWLIKGPLPEGSHLLLHPIAFSGWIGLLVTSLNLLPVGQLDGGHVAYAVLGSKQGPLAKVVVLALVIMGVTGWSGWLVWALLVTLMGIYHPPVVYDWIPLGKRRKVIGWLTLTIFIVTFIPKPF